MNENLRKKRSKKQFIECEVTVKKYGEDDVIIHRIGKPGKRCEEVVFINAEGVLTVTGDYGNWVFCREFHPTADGYVSDSYWIEKLKIASSQQPGSYDADETRKEIEQRLNDGDLYDEDKEYLESLLGYVDDGEAGYLAYAHENLPKYRDHEFVPYRKKLDYWLEVIFDAFEEICRRLEKDMEPKGLQVNITTREGA